MGGLFKGLLKQWKWKVILSIVPIFAGILIVVVMICVLAATFTSNAQGPSSTVSATTSGSISTVPITINTPGNVPGLPVSYKLIAFIEGWEGYAATGERGVDSWNVTIGYGHVMLPGDTFTYLTQQQAEQLLLSDLQTEGCISSVQKAFAGVPLTQPQFDSLVTLAFGIGGGHWNTLSLTQDIKSGADGATILADFEKISYCGGSFCQGLFNRRHAEGLMFTQGVYTIPA